MTRKVLVWLGMVSVALFALGCGGGGESSSGSASILGTHVIESWVENTSSCDLTDAQPGAHSNGFFVVESCSFTHDGWEGPGGGGESWTQAFTCGTPENCEEQKCSEDVWEQSEYVFDSGNSGNGWESFNGASSGMPEGGVCTAWVWKGKLSSDADGVWSYVIRQMEIEFTEVDADGWCDLDKAIDLYDEGTCVGIEVITLAPPE